MGAKQHADVYRRRAVYGIKVRVVELHSLLTVAEDTGGFESETMEGVTTSIASADKQFPASQRISAIAESATLAVDAKAKALKAEGRPVIGFGAGEPDFATPDHIVQAAVEACQNPVNHRYSPAPGLPELRAAIAQTAQRDNNFEVDPSQVVVTNGGKQAIYEAFAAIINPGDEVILPAPYWTTYPESINLAGGRTVEVFAGAEAGYLVTVDQLEAARTEKTRAMVLCSPSNPTGAVYPPEQIKAIGQWAVKHGIWIVSDDIYQNLLYDDAVATAVPAVVPEAKANTIIVSGVAKTFAMTGWRVGWMIAPAHIAKAAANLQSHMTSNVANVPQRAALAALTGPMAPVEEMRQAFDRRRRRTVELLNAIPGFSCPTPQGAFYAYPDVSGVLGKTVRGRTPKTSIELAELILEEAEVAVVPGEAFGPSGFLRLSYATSDEDIEVGIERIAELLKEAQ